MEGRATMALQEHHAILDALAAHDPDAAERAMRTHIHNARLHARLVLEQTETDAPAQSD